MQRESNTGIPDQPVTIRTGTAQASFQRSGPTSANLEIKYDVNGLAIDLSARPLQAGVAALCEQEIAHMRRSLSALGDELAGQLSDAGRGTVIDDKWNDEDSRMWRDTGTAFHVKPSEYKARVSLTTPEGVADAKLVREAVRNMIAQRETSIRKLYRGILDDATGNRRQTRNG